MKLSSTTPHTMRAFVSALIAVFVFATGAIAQNNTSTSTADDPPKEQNIFEKNGIKLIHGPAKVNLGRYAEIDLPANHAFIQNTDIKKYYDLTHNPYSGNEIGVVISYDGWVIHFDYADSGHIDDKDKSDLDADALYKAMQDGQKIGNEERKQKGWDELMLKGWTSKPHYDEKTNNLTWAYRLASSQDSYKATFINQNIRLLGRTGYVSAIVVGEDSADYAKTETQANELLKKFHFVSGQTYAEFRSGDKVAQYGLAALVLGGAGAIAAKTGFLTKFGKFIIFGIAAIGAWFVKIFKKITGRNTDSFGDNPNP